MEAAPEGTQGSGHTHNLLLSGILWTDDVSLGEETKRPSLW